MEIKKLRDLINNLDKLGIEMRMGERDVPPQINSAFLLYGSDERMSSMRQLPAFGSAIFLSV